MNVKHEICQKFLLNPTINPISNKNIEIGGPTFKKLVKLCTELEYDDEVDDLLNSLVLNEKIGLTGFEDIEQMIILSDDLEIVVKLLRTDPRLRTLVYKLMPVIIKNYIKNHDHHDIISFIGNQDKDDIIWFIDNLIEMKEFTLIKRLVIELNKNSYLILNYDLDDIIELVKLSKFSNELNDLLLNLIPDIVVKYINSFETTEDIKYVEFGINDFIKKLLYLHEYDLTRIAMEKFVSVLDDKDDYHLIIQDIFTYDDYFSSQVIEGYMKMIPIDFDVERIYRGIEQTIINELIEFSNDEEEDKIISYVRSILTASTNLKDIRLMNIIREIIGNDLNISYETYEILNELIKQAQIKMNYMK